MICCDRWLFSAKSVMLDIMFSSVPQKKHLIIWSLWFWYFGLVAWVCFFSKVTSQILSVLFKTFSGAGFGPTTIPSHFVQSSFIPCSLILVYSVCLSGIKNANFCQKLLKANLPSRITCCLDFAFSGVCYTFYLTEFPGSHLLKVILHSAGILWGCQKTYDLATSW